MGENDTNNNYYDSNVSGNVMNESFIDDERPVATLRNGMVLNLVSGEGFKNEQAILTDKRMYYNHKKGIINKFSTREIVDVKDITGTKIKDSKPYSLLILALLFPLAALIFEDIRGWIYMGLLIAAVIIVVFFFTIKKWLIVEYAGGSIRLSVKKYSMKNIIAFQKAIYKVKENNKK
ncbi:MAG: hypothetical protein ACI4L2_01665 [Wujia sp.]